MALAIRFELKDTVTLNGGEHKYEKDSKGMLLTGPKTFRFSGDGRTLRLFC